MNRPEPNLLKVCSTSGRLMLVAALAVGLVTACASAPHKDVATDSIMRELASAEADPEIVEFAALEISEARRLAQALQAARDEELRVHLFFMVRRQLAIARAVAQRKSLETQALNLQKERAEILAEARRRDAEQSRAEAEKARAESVARAEELARVREELARARQESSSNAHLAELAQAEANQEHLLARAQRRKAELAQHEARIAQESAAVLRQQLEATQARHTERGLVFTLGGVLFEFGKAGLKPEVKDNLGKLVAFLAQYPDRPVRVEGYTDSRGRAAYNKRLSKARADNVVAALKKYGVDTSRIETEGMGEAFPVASNDSEQGRARNRRVEVIVLDPKKDP